MPKADESLHKTLNTGAVTKHSHGSKTQPQKSPQPKHKKRQSREKDMLELTNVQRVLLKDTWSPDFEKRRIIGEEIYLRIFQLDPEAKNLFPYMQNASFKETIGFKDQALRFTKILSAGVSAANSDKPENASNFVKELKVLGKRHVKLAKRGFHPQHWVLFIKATVDVMQREMNGLESENKQQALEAWQKLADYIVIKMKLGYYGEKQQDMDAH